MRQQQLWRWIIGAVSLWVLAACTSDAPPPTLARLATDTPPVVAQQSTAAGRPTLPATFTPTDEPTITPTVTVTPSLTITFTPTHTPTPLPTVPVENRPVLGLLDAAARFTPLPEDFEVPDAAGYTAPTPTPSQQAQAPATDESGNRVIPGLPTATIGAVINTPEPCPYYPPGGFADVYLNNPDVAQQLGCLTNPPETDQVPAAWQPFQLGLMFWLSDEDRIYALYSVSDDYRSFPDTFTQGVDPERSSDPPPEGLVSPSRGFLKVWDEQAGIRDTFGWATRAEQGVPAVLQEFPNGKMISLGGRNDILVLIGTQESGIWQAFSGQF